MKTSHKVNMRHYKYAWKYQVCNPLLKQRRTVSTCSSTYLYRCVPYIIEQATKLLSYHTHSIPIPSYSIYWYVEPNQDRNYNEKQTKKSYCIYVH